MGCGFRKGSKRDSHVFIIIEMSTKKGGGQRYFSEESTGFKISPKTVLIMSLIYIGIVVLLHIYSKASSPSPATASSSSDGPRPAGEEATGSETPSSTPG